MLKSVLVAAALGAAMLVAPVAAQAATANTPLKGMSDVQLYCTFFSWTAKCAPAAAVAPKAAPAKVAAVKPAAVKPVAARAGIKMLDCTKAAPGKAYLYSCSWK